MEIVQKIVIITGGLGGIAIATTKVLLQEGAKYVALFDLHESKKTIIHDLETEFGKERIEFYVCDVRNRKQFEEKYDEVVKTQGSVDLLINTAGIFNENEPELEIDVNFKATVLCTLAAIDRMGKHLNGNGGTIINISSVAGLSYFHEFPVYAATKHAIVGFTRSLKDSYEKYSIRTMVLCPGLTNTPLLQNEDATAFLSGLNFDGYIQQTAESVGLAVAKMVKKGEPGAVWVVKKNEPPFAVTDVEHYEKRRQSIS